MKKYAHILGIILLATICSCEKILDVQPTYYVSGEEAITDRNGVQNALNGVYDGLQQTGFYGRHMVTIPDLTADNLEWKGTTQEYGQFDNNSLLSDNLIVESIWNAHYDVLNRLNFLLSELPDVGDMTQAEKVDVESQCLFIRALCHFNLVRLFGDVPVKTEPTVDLNSNLDAARNSVPNVYQQIQQDLADAEGNIENNNPGFVTNGAIIALQAKVALYLQDYETAKSKATEVINSGYELEPVFADLFTQDVSDEAIFLILFNEQDGNRLAEYFYPTAQGGRYELAPSEDIISAFEAEDERLTASITGNPPYVSKYNDLVTMANNVYCIRLAELYLLRAEAEARLQGSVQAIRNDINILRNRAGLSPIETDDYQGLLLDIEMEHRRELAFEGHRWFELVRTGRAIQVIPTVTNEYQLLFPVPITEIQNNNSPGMYQNPGY